MSLLSKYLLELDYGVFSEICRNLDIQAKYRDLVAAADNTRFRLELVSLSLNIYKKNSGAVDDSLGFTLILLHTKAPC